MFKVLGFVLFLRLRFMVFGLSFYFLGVSFQGFGVYGFRVLEFLFFFF